MAADIAFALGILSLWESSTTVLKIFLTALAVIDDLERLWLLLILYETILWSNLLCWNNVNVVYTKPHES
jgi:Na+/H+ antiporter NhaA